MKALAPVKANYSRRRISHASTPRTYRLRLYVRVRAPIS